MTIPYQPLSKTVYLAIIFVSLGLIVSHILYFYPHSIIDDTFITLRYAERFADGKGITWNDGYFVEGYSSLSWVLLNAWIHKLGIPLETSSLVLGTVSACLIIWISLRYLARQAITGLELAIAAAILISMPPLAIWAGSGMETGFAAFLITLAATGILWLFEAPHPKQAFLVSIPLSILIITRPEAPIYIGSLALSWLVFSRDCFKNRLSIMLWMTSLPVLVYLAQLGWRWHYYGEWVPNTVLVKVTFTEYRFIYGSMYTLKAVTCLLPVIFYCLCNFAIIRRNTQKLPPQLAFLCCFIAVIIAAIWAAGGDIFFGLRPFVAIIPAIVILMMLTYRYALPYSTYKKELVFLGVIGLAQISMMQLADINRINVKQPGWVFHAREIGLALKKRFAGQNPTIATHAAGAIPFYSQLNTLDVYGLNDRDIAKLRSLQPRFGYGLIGHELFDGNYIASRKPDILVFDIPGAEPMCIKDHETECDKLLPHYRKETLDIPGHHVDIWIRKDRNDL